MLVVVTNGDWRDTKGPKGTYLGHLGLALKGVSLRGVLTGVVADFIMRGGVRTADRCTACHNALFDMRAC